MGATSIEWTDATVNWQSGCTNAGPECDNCYAEKMSQRLANMGQDRYRNAASGWAWTGRITFDHAALDRAFADLFRKRKALRVFPGSMTDLWHRDAPADGLRHFAEWVDSMGRAITAGTCPPHVLQCLTKRPENMLAWQREHFPDGLPACFWAGVTAGNQRGADIRVPKLLNVKAETRFVSVEPMLGAVDFREIRTRDGEHEGEVNALRGWAYHDDGTDTVGRLHWIIVGCESLAGKPGRPVDLAWVRSLRDQCAASGTAFFLKQLVIGGTVTGTPALDGRTWTEFPAVRA